MWRERCACTFKAEGSDFDDHNPPVVCSPHAYLGWYKPYLHLASLPWVGPITRPLSQPAAVDNRSCDWDRPGRRKRAQSKTNRGEENEAELRRTIAALLWQGEERGTVLKVERCFQQFGWHLQCQLRAFHGMDFMEALHRITEKDATINVLRWRAFPLKAIGINIGLYLLAFFFNWKVSYFVLIPNRFSLHS